MTREQRQHILAEAVNTFGRQQWFRDAAVYDSFPTSGEPTIEFKVNYIPLFEKKTVKQFASKYNLADRYIIVDANGNRVE